MFAEIGCADKHSATRISHLEYEMTVHFVAKRMTAKSIGCAHAISVALFSAVALLPISSRAQEPQPQREEAAASDTAADNDLDNSRPFEERQAEGNTKLWAVICVGLPGDTEYEEAFRGTANLLQSWLVQTLRFPPEQVIRLPAQELTQAQSDARGLPANSVTSPLTAERLRVALSDVSSKLMPEDSLWIITLGHGNHDGRQAWFHLAGKDPSAEDFGKWLNDVRCREQIVWLTHSSSGWFIKPLSRPGRIVISATAADDESNATEFPHAFAAVIQRPLLSLDTNQDGALSIVELLNAIAQEVDRRFKSDNRLPTEHSQLDDNGDGLGTEIMLQPEFGVSFTNIDPATLSRQKAAFHSNRALRLDGSQASATFVPNWASIDNSIPEKPTVEKAISEKTGTQREKN